MSTNFAVRWMRLKITTVENIKLQGVSIDSRLKSDDHIKSLYLKVKRNVSALSRAATVIGSFDIAYGFRALGSPHSYHWTYSTSKLTILHFSLRIPINAIVENVKLLGVIMDSKLKSDDDVKSVLKLSEILVPSPGLLWSVTHPNCFVILFSCLTSGIAALFAYFEEELP